MALIKHESTKARRFLNNYDTGRAAQAELELAINRLDSATQYLLNAHAVLIDHDHKGPQGPRIEDLGRQIERATKELRSIKF